ncbi:flavin-containing monooxygenase [Aquipuribacter sp. MA13-6]|uniref:flavin-containing monooxygenase n=1 Tax=unclassified Aquipuribacter TaxID=2635084 RepID=UPI003EEE446E
MTAAHVRVAVVGAGFAGLGMAARLRQGGERSLVVLERADEVGGTWRENTYPGAACDIRSDLYSFSFAPNPGWTSLYAGQAEIKAYLERTTDQQGLRPYLRLGTEVGRATWDEAAALWRVDTNRGAWTAEVLVVATGPLVQPRWPDLPGLETFAGPRLHSAEWDHDVELTGRRVGVIGTGASAVQLVPPVAERAAHLTVFQRSAPWVVPRGDHGTSALRRRVFERVPWLQRLSRERVLRRNDLNHVVLANRAVGRVAERVVLAWLHRQVADPALRRALTPGYRLGCKRILVSDDYYPALTRDDVDLVTDAITRVTPTGVVTADGTEHPLDVLVCSTGFVATDPPVSHRVVGRDGRTLAQHWSETGMQALRGTTVAGFPNLFYLVGPNTALGHNSIVEVIEAQVDHVRQVLDRAGAGLWAGERAVVETTRAAQQAWSAQVQADLARSVWVTGGCTSFYLDAEGRNTTLWPHRVAAFRRAMRRPDASEHHRRVVRDPTRVEGVDGAAVHLR